MSDFEEDPLESSFPVIDLDPERVHSPILDIGPLPERCRDEDYEFARRCVDKILKSKEESADQPHIIERPQPSDLQS